MAKSVIDSPQSQAEKVAADYLLRRLRVRHLQLLAILDDLGTVRAAADELKLTQPAVSKMLVEVESAFGHRLFERGRRGVSANAYGRAAIHRARVVLNELQGAAHELESMRGSGGLLRLGTLSVTDIVPAAVVRLLRCLPGSCVQIREGRVQDLIAALLDGELDCVFGSLIPATIETQPIEQLTVKVIFEDRLCVLLNAAHALARKRRLQWADLLDCRWVASPRSTVMRQAFIGAFTNLGLAAPAPVIELLSPVTLRGLLARDDTLVGVVRFENGRQNDASTGLKLLEVDATMALPPLCAFTRRTSVGLPEIVRVFVGELEGVAGQADRGRSRAVGL